MSARPRLDAPLYALALSVLRVAVAAHEAEQHDLCAALQDIAFALDELGDEQADIHAGVDRLAQALAFSSEQPWTNSTPTLRGAA